MSSYFIESKTAAAYEMLDQAIWIIDPDINCIVWGNRAALALWEVDNVTELTWRAPTQALYVDGSPRELCDRICKGKRGRFERTVASRGVEVRLELLAGLFIFPSGRVGLLVQALPARAEDPHMLLAAQALQQAPIVTAVFKLDGIVVHANGLARQTFGSVFSLRSIFCHAADYDDLVSYFVTAPQCSRDVQLYTTTGKRWFALDARLIHHPVTREVLLCFHAVDAQARVHAERVKDDLVSVVSHELRTPMTAIRGAVELLAGGAAEDEPELSSELLQIAAENTRRLNTLINDLLDLRKLATGRLSFLLEECDLQSILLNVVELQMPAAKAKGVELFLSARHPLPVFADEGRLQQVILNLLSNAIKHSPPGGLVVIAGEIEDDKIRISVADEGPGVPETLREQIFERFSSTDISSTRASTGVGLGLYMAKKLVELHRGRLEHENRPEGGATFWFELPLREAQRAVA